MAEKRKSENNLVLQQGEGQRPDGRFYYRYTDNEGERHVVYAWRLRPQDPTPPGKKAAASLRELEEQIKKDLAAGVKSWENNVTLGELIEDYMQSKRNKGIWRVSTAYNNGTLYDAYIKKRIGRKRLNLLKRSDFESFYLDLANRDCLKNGTIASIKNLIDPVLELAVTDGLIQRNFAKGIASDVMQGNRKGRAEKREPLEPSQQEMLLRYIKENRSQEDYNLFYLLAWTGCRLNEMLALSWLDIDFKNETIKISKSLSYTRNIDDSFSLTAPKTEAGNRIVPMLADVKEILQDMKPNVVFRSASTKERGAFLFKTRTGNFVNATNIDAKLRRIARDFQQDTGQKLPDNFCCHTFRHSFCCWLCENVEGANSAGDLKYIQRIMGHANAQVTLDVYSAVRPESHQGRTEKLKKCSKRA